MAEEMEVEDYPTEIEEQLTGFESSVGSVSEMLKQMMAVPRSDLSQKLDPLEQAKLDLMSAYTLNSLFWMYLVTQGVNPREHSVKQELERIRTYMNRVKDITDRKKAARLNKGAASRFVRNALYDAEERESGKAAPAAKKAAHTPGRAPQLKRPKKR